MAETYCLGDALYQPLNLFLFSLPRIHRSFFLLLLAVSPTRSCGDLERTSLCTAPHLDLEWSSGQTSSTSCYGSSTVEDAQLAPLAQFQPRKEVLAAKDLDTAYVACVSFH